MANKTLISNPSRPAPTYQVGLLLQDLVRIHQLRLDHPVQETERLGVQPRHKRRAQIHQYVHAAHCTASGEGRYRVSGL